MSSNLKFFITDSFQGYSRKNNKDDILTIDSSKYFLAFLFDGVSGSVNAKKCIEIVKNFIGNKHDLYYSQDHYRLEDLMYDANEELMLAGIENGYSTYSAYVYIKCNANCYISNLGDSRIYGVSKQYKYLYTIDDSESFNKNIITKALGLKLPKKDFVAKEIVEREEKFLLCSDGFYEILEKNNLTFHRVFNYKYLGRIKKRLKNLITTFKNQDDATYIYICIAKLCLQEKAI